MIYPGVRGARALIKGRKVDSGTSFVRFNDAPLINSVSSMLTSTVPRNCQREREEEIERESETGGPPVYVESLVETIQPCRSCNKDETTR